MASLELNVVSILIGVLIARILIIWVFTLKYYVESTVDYDQDESERDYDRFKRDIIGSIICTGVAGLFIILIIEWYRQEINE
jgi:hypothetical protein